MALLLYVCTGNTCRSPMAAALSPGIFGSSISVSSAGTLESGRPANPRAVEVISKRRIDISSHRSRNVFEALQPLPDLIIGLASEHIRTVVDSRHELFGRAFTLKEFVRRAKEVGPRHPGEELDDYVARVGEGRELWHLAGIRSQDDVADPIGGTLETYERCATELEDLLRRMAALLRELR